MISNTPDTFFSRRMKLLSILVLPIWAVGATAQGITIGSPEQGKNVFPGQQLTIQVIKNDCSESLTEAGFIIGFTPCPANTHCSPANLGTILYNGPFNPQQDGQIFSEKFTVKIPSDAPTGKVQIGFARFFLIGAGNCPTVGLANVTVNVVRLGREKIWIARPGSGP